MTPQDRPARRFDEPPAYEDLELDTGWMFEAERDFYREQERRRLARRSHLGAIVILAAVVVLVVIAAALFLSGAS